VSSQSEDSVFTGTLGISALTAKNFFQGYVEIGHLWCLFVDKPLKKRNAPRNHSARPGDISDDMFLVRDQILYLRLQLRHAAFVERC